LPTAEIELKQQPTFAAGKPVEVTRVRITDAGSVIVAFERFS
jgi:hypothetical protein